MQTKSQSRLEATPGNRMNLQTPEEKPLRVMRREKLLAPSKVVYFTGDSEKVVRYDVLSDRWGVLEQKNTS
jgi:hypothetical protein